MTEADVTRSATEQPDVTMAPVTHGPTVTTRSATEQPGVIIPEGGSGKGFIDRPGRERSRSRDFPRGGSKGKGKTAAPAPDAADRRLAYGLEEQIVCRDRNCDSRQFTVYVPDPDRLEHTELTCTHCGTTTSIDLERRLIYRLLSGQMPR